MHGTQTKLCHALFTTKPHSGLHILVYLVAFIFEAELSTSKHACSEYETAVFVVARGEHSFLILVNSSNEQFLENVNIIHALVKEIINQQNQ